MISVLPCSISTSSLRPASGRKEKRRRQDAGIGILLHVRDEVLKDRGYSRYDSNVAVGRLARRSVFRLPSAAASKSAGGSDSPGRPLTGLLSRRIRFCTFGGKPPGG